MIANDENKSEATPSNQAAKDDHDLENKIAVALGVVFAPGRRDRPAIVHDAIGKHETAASI